MEPGEHARLKEYLEALDESEIHSLLVEYFVYRRTQADIVHSTGEHGMDVVAYVDWTQDFLRKGYNVIIQAKPGGLSLDEWRREVLFQLLELPYYRIPHHNYQEHLPRRVVLVALGDITLEARNSIKEFNKKHDVTIEALGLEDLIRLFDLTGFATSKLLQITGIGQPEAEQISAEVPSPPPPEVGG